MARPLKYGLDYFPMDVDFFEDDKIQFVSSRFDEKGELISVKLLCKIFKAGYFIKWDEDVALLFAKGAGRNISPSLVNEVVNELIKRDFFHKGLFERFAILTSNGIQKRYEHICTIAKRKEWKIEPIYDVTLFTPEETPITPAQTQKTPAESTQRKVKESKENKSKGNEGASLPEEVFKELVLENPFSEKFLETWIIWKEYKKKEFKFLFRSLESEQASINELVKLSSGDEQKAIAIIHQSMANGWKGLFHLKTEENGKSNHQNGKTGPGAKVTGAELHSSLAKFRNKG